jgi:hypothetical protein
MAALYVLVWEPSESDFLFRLRMDGIGRAVARATRRRENTCAMMHITAAASRCAENDSVEVGPPGRRVLSPVVHGRGYFSPVVECWSPRAFQREVAWPLGKSSRLE